MSAPRKAQKEIPLDTFIDYIINEHGKSIMCAPDIIAKLFCDYFHIAANKNAINAKNLCNTLGILPPVEFPIPPGLDGAYFKTANDLSIICNNTTSEDSIDYIYLHELYEIIYNRIQPDVSEKLLSNNELEIAANSFAGALLMPFADYLYDCIHMRFDPQKLKAKYRQSYKAIISRMYDVMKIGNSFVAILFEHKLFTSRLSALNSTMPKDEIKSITNMPDWFNRSLFSCSTALDDDIFRKEWSSPQYILDEELLRSMIYEALEDNIPSMHKSIELCCLPRPIIMTFKCYPILNKLRVIDKIIILGIDRDNDELFLDDNDLSFTYGLAR